MIRAVTIKDLVGMDIRGYHLNRLIGTGSYGAVYEASSGSERIAVKASIRSSDVLNEAVALQRLFYCEFTPKYFFHEETPTQNGILHTIGQELLGADLESIRQRVPWHAIKRPTLVRIAWQAISCLQAVHSYNLVHRDVKLGNFAVSLPTSPNHRVTIKIFDLGLAHHYKDDDGNLIDDSTNPKFNVMKYCSFEVAMGCEPMPKDDLHQLSYAILYASGYDFLQKMKSPPDELIAWKREMLREPSKTLPPLARFLTPWFEALSELNDIVPIDYENLKQKIQQSLPAHNASADLYMEMLDGEPTLV
ncbi:hypothetical protein L3Y34_013375 [Caenorhabditis briggsae]|uniref:Protein kinase domain-containing protein n=1 Tax=Caenorhabditis briggsae TaxID=6238 RepID=A0AAE9CXI9_CAEBR|nr:hypothetical protein L3Y34_013375 [Caenorhabditis briggsae]